MKPFICSAAALGNHTRNDMSILRRVMNLRPSEPSQEVLSVDVIEENKSRVFFIADADIDADGPGGSIHDDPDWQPETSLKHNGQSIDSRKVRGIVVPIGIIKGVKGTVLGCKARVTRNSTGVSADAVVYDIGPSRKLGEISIAAAEAIGIDPSPTHGGEDSYDAVTYELWPSVPAVVDGVQYDLQPWNG